MINQKNNNQQTSNRQTNQEYAEHNFAEDEIDLLELWQAIYKRKILILLSSCILALVMAIVALSKDNQYKSEVLLSPVTSETGGMSGLAAKYGGLSGLAGIDLPSGGAGNITQEALSVLKSRRFLYAFIQQNNLKPILFSENWDKDNHKWIEPSALINTQAIKESIFGESASVAVVYEGMEILEPGEPSIFSAYSLFRNNILNISQDQKTEIITLSITWTNPVLARNWANQLVLDINEQLRRENIQQLMTTNEYLKTTLQKVKLVELREVMFSLIQENIKGMTLAKTRADYIFKIIDPAIVAEQKHAPKRSLMVMIGFILGLMLGVFIALILNWKENSKEVLKKIPSE